MSHISDNLLKVIDINIWIRITLIVVMCSIRGLSSFAYQPGVSELESRVASLELQLSEMEMDSSMSQAQIHQIKDSIIEIQSRIVHTKESTIDGLRRQQSFRTDNRETLGLIAFGLLLFAVMSFAFILLFGKRLRLQEGSGIMQILANDLQTTFTPQKEESKSRRRIHFLVWISVIIMFGSMVMFLVRVL